MYVAIKYVDTGRKVYSPGEIIEDDPYAEWHLKKKAIRLLGETVEVPVNPKNGGETEEERERRLNEENYAAQLKMLGYSPDDNPLRQPSDDTETENHEEEAEEAYEEPEAPEVDVTAALVQETEEKPKGKKGGKKK